jgi:hypothetical protein
MSNIGDSPTIGEIVGLEEYASEMADHYVGFDVAEAEAVLIANGFRKPASRAQGVQAMLIAKGYEPDPTHVQAKTRRPRKRQPTLASGYRYMLKAGGS